MLKNVLLLLSLLILTCTQHVSAHKETAVEAKKNTINQAELAKTTNNNSERVLLDRVVAVVQDKAIMLSDLEARLSKIDKSNVSLPVDFRQQVLESLIIETLQLQRAKQIGININDEQLAAAIQNIAQNNGLASVNELIAKVKEQGGSFDEFREMVRKDLTIRHVSMAEIQAEMQITENEIKEFLASDEGKKIIEPKFHLGHIFLALEDNATNSAKNTAKQKAEEVYNKLQQGANFYEIAIQYSDSATAREDGGDLSWKKATELPSFFAEQAQAMQNGEVSLPILKSNGYHIFKLFESQGLHPEIKQEFKIRHILVKPSAIQTEQQAKEAILKLKRRIENGEEFAKLAKEYSEDKFSGSDGGNLDWITLEELTPDFANTVKQIPLKTLSEPVKTSFGWHLIEVLDKRTEDVTAKNNKQLAYEYLASQKYSHELQSWVQKLRDSASVEIKLDE